MSNKSVDIIDNMNNFQISRWIALYEAVNIIADKVEQSGGVFGYTHMKPSAIENYVETVSSDIYKSLVKKERNDYARRSKECT